MNFVAHCISPLPIFVRVIDFEDSPIDKFAFFDQEFFVWIDQFSGSDPILNHTNIRPACGFQKPAVYSSGSGVTTHILHSVMYDGQDFATLDRDST